MSGVGDVFAADILYHDPCYKVYFNIYHKIMITMINLQDALKRKGDAYGGLWADEGVSCIAKEIQLPKPDKFDNIFLSLGGFDMEKILLACLGSYLEPSGIFNVLVKTECFGTNVIKSVISGSHYSRAHTSYSLIHEVLTSMMLKAFFSNYPERQKELEVLQVNCQSKELICEEWNTTKVHADAIPATFEVYLKDRALISELFKYLNTYVSDRFPPSGSSIITLILFGKWNYISPANLTTREVLQLLSLLA